MVLRVFRLSVWNSGRGNTEVTHHTHRGILPIYSTRLAPERQGQIWQNEKMEADPWDVISMSNAYKEPELCNYYCANECPIGRKYVPEIKVKDLSQVILEMLASLNSMQKRQERLIEITADGMIQKDEIEDFINIQKELEKISVTVETLQLWTERMIATGKIDVEKYNAYK